MMSASVAMSASAAPAAEETPAPLLRTSGLRVYFVTARGVVRAVDGVDLSIAAGETMGLVGESGSGKTVLARALMGAVGGDDVLIDGQIVFDDIDLVSASTATRRRVLGRDITMVFQNPMQSLHPVLRIGYQLTEGMRLHLGLPKSEARKRAIELLRAVRIAQPESRMRQYPHELSGGMRQRVGIAIAIACSPRLLLADEPTTALDVTVQAEVLDLLADQQRQRGMTMVLTSHDLGVIATRTDSIAVMYAGKIVERAPTPVLFEAPRHHYTRALISCIPRLDQPGRIRLATVEGQPPSLLDPPPGCRFAPRCPAAQAKCHSEEPPLASAPGAPAHQVACWFPADAPASGEVA
jgi:peptide/nickel transport system ATP-binding protein